MNTAFDKEEVLPILKAILQAIKVFNQNHAKEIKLARSIQI